MNCASKLVMPMPAVPKPTTTIFCCSSGMPVTLIAEINVAVATAAVP